MKTVTVREVRQNFGKLLAWVEAGEEVTVTLRRRPVARLVPALPEKLETPIWPDFAGRQRKLFGKRVVSDVVAAERESYSW